MGRKNKNTPKRRWHDAPSPCIDVCKYPGGICKGCGMTKPEKKQWKRLSGKAERKPFLMEIRQRLGAMERKRLEWWEAVYRRKCAKKSVPCPLDKLSDA